MTTIGKTAVVFVVLLTLAAAAVAVAAIADDGLGDRAEAVLEDPQSLVGQRVTVRGELSSYFPNALTLGGGWLNNEELLVVVDDFDQLPEPVRERRDDIDVRVTGVVGIKDDSLELVPGRQFEPFEDGAPFVRAQRIEVLEG